MPSVASVGAAYPCSFVKERDCETYRNASCVIADVRRCRGGICAGDEALQGRPCLAITGYAVYRSQAHTPQDADLILTVAFPNMAALDRTDEADAISTKVLGPMDSRDKASMDRESMRELLGSELTRELILN